MNSLAAPLLTVVVPLYNEEPVIGQMYARLHAALEPHKFDYEIILVNDGSRDRTEEMAVGICRDHPNVKLVSFSRNFGHQLAVTAGLDHARGQAVVIIDADLQDPP